MEKIYNALIILMAADGHLLQSTVLHSKPLSTLFCLCLMLMQYITHDRLTLGLGRVVGIRPPLINMSLIGTEGVWSRSDNIMHQCTMSCALPAGTDRIHSNSYTNAHRPSWPTRHPIDKQCRMVIII